MKAGPSTANDQDIEIEHSTKGLPESWLVKFAPFRTSWGEIVRRGTFTLRGIRSPEARRHLSTMRVGDPVLFYHSQEILAIVGLMEVAREAYTDPSSPDGKWLTCDFRPLKTLRQPVSLGLLRGHAAFANLPLIRQPRLAVMPVGPDEFSKILALAES